LVPLLSSILKRGIELALSVDGEAPWPSVDGSGGATGSLLLMCMVMLISNDS
jgi:hypothetical protein